MGRSDKNLNGGGERLIHVLSYKNKVFGIKKKNRQAFLVDSTSMSTAYYTSAHYYMISLQFGVPCCSKRGSEITFARQAAGDPTEPEC